MNNLIQLTKTSTSISNSISLSPLRRVSLLIPLVFVCFGLSPAARAVLPAPDGGYPGQNTAEGDDALFSLTTGADNTAIGFDALSSDSDGNNNTATGAGALKNNDGDDNTAMGTSALATNTTGSFNTAVGIFALSNNTTGYGNTADGNSALEHNSSGVLNTATGDSALGRNTTGKTNTANGEGALFNNTTGNHNIAIGASAGERLTTGSNNIDIGNQGVAGEANTIRIGERGAQKSTFVAGISGTAISGTQVVVNSNGKLGVAGSSARFKERIKPMGEASEAVLKLKPVTFRYKEEIDPDATPQFGLVAEDVAKVNPDLVVRDTDGKVYTVRYEAVNAMLLNEFLKEHRKVHEQEATITQLKKDFQATVAQLATRLDEQAAQIQKVSAQLEASKPAPQVVNNP